MTDEDACYAAAQWASGIRQHEIAASFGVSESWISNSIERFVRKYTDVTFNRGDYGGRMPNSSFVRRALVKGAIARFLALRQR